MSITAVDPALVWATTFGAAMVRQQFDRIADGRGPAVDDAEQDRFAEEAECIADMAVAAMKRAWPRAMRELRAEREAALAEKVDGT